jgi:hypothetical protein
MTGDSFKTLRKKHGIARWKIAKEMEISESRTQQIEGAGRLTSRMSERYASAIEQILRRRKALADLIGKTE